LNAALKLKESAITEVKKYMEENKNATLQRNYDIVLENLNGFKIGEVNDDLISKILTISKLRQELLEN
jgi:hypothetical protein